MDTDREVTSARGDKKFIVRCEPDFGDELYDLASDPKEKNDLILDDPTLAGGMFEALAAVTVADSCKIIAGASRGRKPEDLLTPEQIEELKSLAYIQ